jgi:hypothetical protein
MIVVSIVAIAVWTRWSGRRTPSEPQEQDQGQEPAAV